MTEFVKEIFEVVILPLLTLLTTYLVAFIKAKFEEVTFNTDNELLKTYLVMLEDAVIACVKATNQTYVDVLKENGQFDYEAQIVAFQKTKDEVIQMIGSELLDFVSVFVGDLDVYIAALIEAAVAEQ